MSDDALEIVVTNETKRIFRVFKMLSPTFERTMLERGVRRINVRASRYIWCSDNENGSMDLTLNTELMDALETSPSYVAALGAFILERSDPNRDNNLCQDLVDFLSFPVQSLPLPKREKEIVHKVPVQLRKVVRTVTGIVCEETGLTFREGIDFVMRFSEDTLDCIYREFSLDDAILERSPVKFEIDIPGLVYLLARSLQNIGLPIHDDLDLTFFEIRTRYKITPPTTSQFRPIDDETGLPPQETYDTLKLWIHGILLSILIKKEGK